MNDVIQPPAVVVPFLSGFCDENSCGLLLYLSVLLFVISMVVGAGGMWLVGLGLCSCIPFCIDSTKVRAPGPSRPPLLEASTVTFLLAGCDPRLPPMRHHDWSEQDCVVRHASTHTHPFAS